MAVTEELLLRLKPDIEEIDDYLRKDIEVIGKDMDVLLGEILMYGLFGGGKRIRPLLAVIAARLCGGRSEAVFRVAIALEYLHMATLFHDDVIDRADLRRGKPSVCKVYGTEGAILTGDFLHARAMELIGLEGGAHALALICGATRNIVNGEFVQLRNTQNLHQNRDDYFHAVEGKTAKLIAAAVRIGCRVGGGSEAEEEALGRYGRSLGFAFQIVDDLLDYLGDQEKTGKIVGNDLVEGKITLPLLCVLEQAERAEKKRLIEILSDSSLRVSCFAEVKAMISRYDGFSQTRQVAESYVRNALDALKIFADERQKDDVGLLEGLANYTLKREK